MEIADIDAKEVIPQDQIMSDHNVHKSHQTIRQMQNEKIKKNPKDKSGYKFDGINKIDDTIDMKHPLESPVNSNFNFNNVLSLNVKSEQTLKEKI